LFEMVWWGGDLDQADLLMNYLQRRLDGSTRTRRGWEFFRDHLAKVSSTNDDRPAHYRVQTYSNPRPGRSNRNNAICFFQKVSKAASLRLEPRLWNSGSGMMMHVLFPSRRSSTRAPLQIDNSHHRQTPFSPPDPAGR
jgi:hypothetical protein